MRVRYAEQHRQLSSLGLRWILIIRRPDQTRSVLAHVVGMCVQHLGTQRVKTLVVEAELQDWSPCAGEASGLDKRAVGHPTTAP
ncbi:MAG: hypothetical protein QOI01_2943 [Mycobacterium sp.]|nr:hypothetical protein [Mycobacterium sp.]